MRFVQSPLFFYCRVMLSYQLRVLQSPQKTHHSVFERIAAEHERIGPEHAEKRAELETQRTSFELTSDNDPSTINVRAED